MSNYVKLATESGDQFLNALAERQDQYLKSVGAFASWVPAAPAAPLPPYAAEMPTLREVAEANFAFATKLLKQQKAFTEKLLAAKPYAAVVA